MTGPGTPRCSNTHLSAPSCSVHHETGRAQLVAGSFIGACSLGHHAAVISQREASAGTDQPHHDHACLRGGPSGDALELMRITVLRTGRRLCGPHLVEPVLPGDLHRIVAQRLHAGRAHVFRHILVPQSALPRPLIDARRTAGTAQCLPSATPPPHAPGLSTGPMPPCTDVQGQ